LTRLFSSQYNDNDLFTRGQEVVKDERLDDLCGVYKKLNIKEKKKVERIAVRLFNTQMSNDNKELSSVDKHDDTELMND
jgi:hypothetical protein